MNILHISAAAITDRFYSTFFSKIEGVKQTVFIPYSSAEFSEDQAKTIEKAFDNICVTSILAPIKNKTDKFLYFKKIQKYSNFLYTHFDIGQVDFIHAHSLFTDGGVANKAYMRYGTPYAVAVRSTDTDLFLRYFKHLSAFAKKILNEADAIVYITPQLKEKAKQILFQGTFPKDIEKKTFVIPNGVDPFWLKNGCQEKTLSNEGDLHLIQVSKLVSWKNVDKTISAVRVLVDRGINCRLSIIGDGPDREKLERQVRDLDLTNIIRFAGYISGKLDIMKEYRQNDIFILPSTSETFGISYIEAMTQGLPILGLSKTGIDGFFNVSPVGIFVNDAVPIQIADGIENIVDNYELYSKNCIEQSKRFNWDSICLQYNDIYHRAKHDNS